MLHFLFSSWLRRTELESKHILIQVKMPTLALVIFCLLSFVGLDFGSGKTYNKIYHFLFWIFLILINIEKVQCTSFQPFFIFIFLGQAGEDVTFLLLLDKGASLEAVNAFGDGLAAFQVKRSFNTWIRKSFINYFCTIVIKIKLL